MSEEVEYQVGDKLIFLKMNAVVRYIGDFSDKPGLWVGIEVDVPKGKNNGTIKGVKYFECEPNHGFFIQYETFVKALKPKSPKPKETQNSMTTPKLSQSTSNSDFAAPTPSHRRKISMSSSMISPDLKMIAEQATAEFGASQLAAESSGQPEPQVSQPEISSNRPEDENNNNTFSNNHHDKENGNKEDNNDSLLFAHQDGPTMSKSSSYQYTQVEEKPKGQKNRMIPSSPIVDSSMKSESLDSFSGLTSEQATFQANQHIVNLKTSCGQIFSKIKADAKKYKDVQSKVRENESQFKARIKRMQDDLNEKLLQIQVEYLPEQIRLEEELFDIAQKEKDAKKKSMMKDVHQSIQMLQSINEEHIKFENTARDIIQKQSLKIESKKKKLNLLDQKLQNQYSLKNEQEEAINEIQVKIDSYEKELKEQLPVTQEAASLRVKIAAHQDALGKVNQTLSLCNNDIETSKKLLSDISPYFNVTVNATALIFRLIEKVNSFLSNTSEDSEKSTLEDVLHICDNALLVLGFSNNNFSDFQNFIDEMTEFETSLDNEIVKTLDINQVMPSLQSVTPIPLNLSISAHLVRAVAFRVKSSAAKDDLLDFSRQIPRIFHPSQMLKNKEDCEKFALSFRSELRKAEKGEEFSIMKYINPLQLFLSNQSKDEFKPKFKVIAPMVNTEIEKELEEVKKEDKELPDLRRRVADLETAYDQLSRYNIVLSQLKKEIPQKIEAMKNELETSEEILKDIESEGKKK